MEVKSGYKRTEVGIIPEDWDVKPLGELGKFKNGINKRKEDFGHGFPFINLMDVFGIPKLSVSTAELGLVNSTVAERKLYELKRGDVLFVRSSVKPEGVGLTSLIPEDLPQTVFSGFLIRFRDAGSLDCGFKEHCFWDERFRGRLVSNSTVSANTNINQDALKRLQIGFPASLPEQRAIAAALSDVDGLLSGLNRLIGKKRDLKQAAMDQLLTGQTRLPGFHGDWQVKQFGEVATPRKERVDPRRNGVQEFCIELEHIDQATGNLIGSTKTGDNASLKSMFRKGDVLFGKLRAYLRKYWMADRAGVCSTEIWVFVPNSKLMTSSYLFQIIKVDRFIESASMAYGTHMPRSDWNVVRNYELRIPSLPEQAAIAEVLTDMDSELAALEQRRVKTRALKQGMMQELLTGKTRLI